MGKYIKKFESHLQYETYMNSPEYITPSVSMCDDELHYDSYVTISITVSSAGYKTYCSELTLDFSSVEGLKAYKAVNISGGGISFVEVGKVPPGNGILLKGSAGTYNIPIIKSTSADFSDNVFVGTTSSISVDPPIFILTVGDAGVGFYQTSVAFTVGANSAYLESNPGGINIDN